MKNEITYTQQGDYLLPDLELPEQPKVKIGIWGRRHERYIKQYHKIRYFDLLTSGTLVACLADIDREATEMYDRLVQQFSKQEGITELLKAKNQILLVRMMNNVRNHVVEIINNEIIYV